MEGIAACGEAKAACLQVAFLKHRCAASLQGWAGTIRYNGSLWRQFQEFYGRADTWSLGVCNGCQLMALLGWVPGTGGGGEAAEALLPSQQQPRFLHNESGRCASAAVGPGSFCCLSK